MHILTLAVQGVGKFQREIYLSQTVKVQTSFGRATPRGSTAHSLIQAVRARRRFQTAEDVGAEEKFWGTPELVDILFPFLDVASILSLAQSNFSSEEDSLVLSVLQRPLVWKKLIERSLPKIPNETFEHQENELEIKKSTIECLTEILKMFKDPVTLEMDLLLLICKRFPPFNNCFGEPELVDVSHHLLSTDQFSTHSVSLVGFTLLESVEGSLGSTQQKIERIGRVGFLKEAWLTAVSERAARQGRKIGEFKCFRVTCLTQESAEAFWTLVDHCQRWSVLQLNVEGEVGPDGWEALRKAVCSPGAVHQCDYHTCVLKPCDSVPRQSVAAPLRYMIEGRREDLRPIWETISSWTILRDLHGRGHELILGLHDKRGADEEDYNITGWRRLEKLMDREKEDKEKEEWMRGRVEIGHTFYS